MKTATLAVVALLVATLPAMGLDFTWPSSTSACRIYNMTLTGGTPPFKFMLISLDSQPLYYNLTEPDGQWFNHPWAIEMQMAPGTFYAAMIADGTGLWGAGGASPLQEVQTGPQGCYEGNSNTSLKVFSFNVSGSTAECDNLRLSWQNPAINGPYWLNVIPLDGTYTPWGIQMSTTNNYYDFQVNMSAGTYFTVMLSNQDYAGGGGVGGLYQVTNNTSSATGCAEQTRNLANQYTLPSGISVQSVSPLSSAAPSSSTSSGPPSAGSSSPTTSPAAASTSAASTSGGGLTTGAIVGIAVGVVLGVAAICIVAFLVVRRRRRAQHDSSPTTERLDLVEDPDPTLEPFMSQVSDWENNNGPGTPHVTQNASWTQPHPNPRQVSASSATPLVAETHTPAFATPRLSPEGHLEKAAFRPQAEDGRGYFSATSGGHPAGVGGSRSGSSGMAGARQGDSEVDSPPAPFRHTDGGLMEEGIPPELQEELPPQYGEVPRSSPRRTGGE